MLLESIFNMRTAGESLFTYSVTRNYPFPWFTWVVIGGGVVLTVLFSILNLATSGYDLQTIYTTDFNSTANTHYWFQSAPFSWINKLQVACQPMQLVRGNTYFTSNFGLIYTVDKIWRNSESGNKLTYPAVSYSGTPITHCEVPQIVLQMERRDQGVNIENDWWTWSESYAYTTATCSVIADKEAYFVNLTVELAPRMRSEHSTDDPPTAMLQRVDVNKQASLWWGAQALVQWYNELTSYLGYGYNAQPEGEDGPSTDSATISKDSLSSTYREVH